MKKSQSNYKIQKYSWLKVLFFTVCLIAGSAWEVLAETTESYPDPIVVLNDTISNGGKKTYAINVPDTGTVSDINVYIKFTIDGTFPVGSIQEVGLRIQDPGTGTWVNLKGTDGGIGERFTVTYDDEAASNLPSFTPNNGSISGTYRPSEALSAFDGVAVNGNWTLEVEDNICSGCSTNIGPTVNEWQIIITYDPSAPVIISPNMLLLSD